MQVSKPIENLNFSNKKLNISILQSQKLFNKNTAFVISLSSQDKMERESDVDLLCVIDISGSMKGNKLNKIKLSLKTIISFMTPKDRLCIILFNDNAKIYLNLAFMTDETKKQYLEKIEKITAKGGTNILSGLKKAFEILIDDNKDDDEGYKNDEEQEQEQDENTENEDQEQ